MRIIIQGVEKFTGGMNGMASEINPAVQQLLNSLALETRTKMSLEAPYNKGNLSRSISVTSPNWFTRIIEPIARNVFPGNRYASAVEDGSGPGYVPNVFSLSQNLGVSTKIGWAIALSIMRKGTPSNPFVERTYRWTVGQLRQEVFPFLTRITARYARGG